jgi:trk system potassium uptake protein TrkH
VVRSVKIGKSAIDSELKINTLVYLVSIAGLFAAGTAALMVLEVDRNIDITTAATASAATLNNIGPGLARVGATQNYEWFSGAGKIVLCILMVLGRLEVFTIVALLAPRFWRTE